MPQDDELLGARSWHSALTLAFIVLPPCFCICQQLNLYGFQRIDDGPERGGFVHQYFQRGQRGLCNLIRRQARGGSAPGASSSRPTETSATAGGGNSNLGIANLPGRPAGASQGGGGQASAQQQGLPQNQQAQAVLQQLLGQGQGQGQTDRRGGTAPG